MDSLLLPSHPANPLLGQDVCWCIEPLWLQKAEHLYVEYRDAIAKHGETGEDEPAGMDVPNSVSSDGILTLNISGVITKRFQFGSELCSSSLLKSRVQKALCSPEVKAVLFVVDSPGGQVAGTADLADAVRSLSTAKPTAAFIEDTGCSAAYWAVCQCREIYCSSTALVGSIGTLLVMDDSSEAFARQGVKVHVVATGDKKGIGTTGMPVREKHLEAVQQMVDSTNTHFVDAVMSGRKLTDSQRSAVLDAGVYVGAEAIGAGLVDGVSTREQALNRLRELASHANRIQKTALNEKMKREGAMGVFKMLLRPKEEQPDSEQRVELIGELIEGSNTAPQAHSSLLELCTREGIVTVEALRERLEMASFGESCLKELRAEARAEAVRCYGAVLGQKIGSTVSHLDAEAVRGIRDGWRAEADARFGIGADGSAPARASAPAAIPRVSVPVWGDEESHTASAWSRLTDSQRALAIRMGMDAPEKREQFAASVLGN